MDRIIAYPGQVPAVEDFLQAQKFAVTSAGQAIQAVMGAVPIATGFAASIDGSANLTLGPGSLSMPGVMDTLPYGVLGTDNTPVTKQGLSNANVVTALFSYTPATAGYACNVLVSASVVDLSTGSVVLAYYNTNAPTTPYNGSAGSGTAQPTELLTRVGLSFTAGAAVAAGSQSTPSAAAGTVPLYVVTLTQGAAPSVAVHPAAPFLAFTLPQLTPGFAREWVFSSSGSFTVPRGSTSVRVYVWGAGGGGGGSTVAGAGAGGGGGGGYTRGVVTVTPGQVIAVSVGTGGAAGVGSANGGPGGGSAFGSVLLCSGGAGGSEAVVAGAAVGGAGGAGSGGSFNQSGLGGGAGVVFTGTSASGGIGGASFQSSPSGLNINAAGPAGQMPGAGGNGGASGYAGGAGAAGLVIVEY
jgi:hypothetical protein